jgi:hypothetical protein
MDALRKPGRWRTWAQYGECYALYAALLVSSVVVFAIWRLAIPALVLAVWGSSNADRLIYDLATILVGMGALILVMVAEPYLRNGVPRQQLMRRFIRLIVPVILAGVLGMLLLQGSLLIL